MEQKTPNWFLYYEPCTEESVVELFQEEVGKWYQSINRPVLESSIPLLLKGLQDSAFCTVENVLEIESFVRTHPGLRHVPHLETGRLFTIFSACLQPHFRKKAMLCLEATQELLDQQKLQ